MHGITVQPGAMSKPEPRTPRRAMAAGRPAGRSRQWLARRGGLAVAVPAALTIALAGPAFATPGGPRPGAATVLAPADVSSPAGPLVSGYQRAKCAVTRGGSDASGTAVVVSDCDGSAAQDWTIEADGTIRAGGMCLDVLSQGTANKTPVDLNACTGGASQHWRTAGGAIVNTAAVKCLDDPRFVTANGTGLEIYACNGGANQLWSPKSWDLTADFARHPAYNPLPDYYRDPGTWTFEYGTQGQQNTYRLQTNNTALIVRSCHVNDVYRWDDHGINPFTTYNGGPPRPAFCGGADNLAGHAVNVSPGAVLNTGNTVGVDEIIAWKSPITGQVSVTATIQGINPREQGITWELYQGGNNLTGPVTENNNQLSTIGPLSVPVTTGQILYLEIGSGSNDGDFDDSTLTLRIDS